MPTALHTAMVLLQAASLLHSAGAQTEMTPEMCADVGGTGSYTGSAAESKELQRRGCGCLVHIAEGWRGDADEYGREHRTTSSGWDFVSGGQSSFDTGSPFTSPARLCQSYSDTLVALANARAPRAECTFIDLDPPILEILQVQDTDAIAERCEAIQADQTGLTSDEIAALVTTTCTDLVAGEPAGCAVPAPFDDSVPSLWSASTGLREESCTSEADAATGCVDRTDFTPSTACDTPATGCAVTDPSTMTGTCTLIQAEDAKAHVSPRAGATDECDRRMTGNSRDCFYTPAMGNRLRTCEHRRGTSSERMYPGLCTQAATDGSFTAEYACLFGRTRNVYAISGALASNCAAVGNATTSDAQAQCVQCWAQVKSMCGAPGSTCCDIFTPPPPPPPPAPASALGSSVSSFIVCAAALVAIWFSR